MWVLDATGWDPLGWLSGLGLLREGPLQVSFPYLRPSSCTGNSELGFILADHFPFSKKTNAPACGRLPCLWGLVHRRSQESFLAGPVCRLMQRCLVTFLVVFLELALSELVAASGWSREPEALFQASHVGAKNSSSWAIFYCLPRHINRERNWKLSSWELNQHSFGMLTLQVAALLTRAQCLLWILLRLREESIFCRTFCFSLVKF